MKTLQEAVELFDNGQVDEAREVISEHKESDSNKYYEEAKSLVTSKNQKLFVSNIEDLICFFEKDLEVGHNYNSHEAVEGIKSHLKLDDLKCVMNFVTGDVVLDSPDAQNLIRNLFKKNVFINVPEGEVAVILDGGLQEMAGEIIVEKGNIFAVEVQSKPNFSAKWLSQVMDKISVFTASVATPRNVAIASIGVSVLASLMGSDAHASAGDVFHKISDAHTKEVLNNIHQQVSHTSGIDFAVKLTENAFDKSAGGGGHGHFEIHVGNCQVHGDYMSAADGKNTLVMGLDGNTADICHGVAKNIMDGMQKKLAPLLNQK